MSILGLKSKISGPLNLFEPSPYFSLPVVVCILCLSRFTLRIENAKFWPSLSLLLRIYALYLVFDFFIGLNFFIDMMNVENNIIPPLS